LANQIIIITIVATAYDVTFKEIVLLQFNDRVIEIKEIRAKFFPLIVIVFTVTITVIVLGASTLTTLKVNLNVFRAPYIGNAFTQLRVVEAHVHTHEHIAH
jgi:hypothetical protein